MMQAGSWERRAAGLAIFAVAMASLVTGAYLVLERFLQDRQSALSVSRPVTAQALNRSRASTTKPGAAGSRPGAPNLPPQTATAAGDAAIQRQLKAIEEINRINETNRRLMEQQRQMGNR